MPEAMKAACWLLLLGGLGGCATRDKVPEATEGDAGATDAGLEAESGVTPIKDGGGDSADAGIGDFEEGELPDVSFDGPGELGEACDPSLTSCQLSLLCCGGKPIGTDGGPTYHCAQPLGTPPKCPPSI